MVKKLATGERLSERDPGITPVNRIRPEDKAAEARHAADRDALFRKT